VDVLERTALLLEDVLDLVTMVMIVVQGVLATKASVYLVQTFLVQIMTVITDLDVSVMLESVDQVDLELQTMHALTNLNLKKT
jgi:hypothetical protein